MHAKNRTLNTEIIDRCNMIRRNKAWWDGLDIARQTSIQCSAAFPVIGYSASYNHQTYGFRSSSYCRHLWLHPLFPQQQLQYRSSLLIAWFICLLVSLIELLVSENQNVIVLSKIDGKIVWTHIFLNRFWQVRWGKSLSLILRILVFSESLQLLRRSTSLLPWQLNIEQF